MDEYLITKGRRKKAVGRPVKRWTDQRCLKEEWNMPLGLILEDDGNEIVFFYLNYTVRSLLKLNATVTFWLPAGTAGKKRSVDFIVFVDRYLTRIGKTL
jgi:hypothetical protein